jgi:hypothetical protein
MLRLALFQTDPVLQARLKSVDDLAGYMKGLQQVCVSSLSDVAKPGALDIVVAVKPGRRSRVWFITSSTATPGAPRLADLEAKLQAVPPPDVNGGPVAFAIIGSVGGALRPHEAGNDLPPPVPSEWTAKAAGKKNVSVPDGMLALAWPD